MNQPKVYEFAKEIGIETLALMDKIRKWELPIKSHMAELSPEVIEQIQTKLNEEAGASKKKKTKKKVAKKKAATKKATTKKTAKKAATKKATTKKATTKKAASKKTVTKKKTVIRRKKAEEEVVPEVEVAAAPAVETAPEEVVATAPVEAKVGLVLKLLRFS